MGATTEATEKNDGSPKRSDKKVDPSSWNAGKQRERERSQLEATEEEEEEARISSTLGKSIVSLCPLW